MLDPTTSLLGKTLSISFFKRKIINLSLCIAICSLSSISLSAQCNANSQATLHACMDDNIGRANIQITGSFTLSTTYTLANNADYFITTNGHSVSWNPSLSIFSGGNGNTSISITTPVETEIYDNNSAPTIQGNLIPLGNFDALLPIELSFFKATLDNHQNTLLIWQTASEINNERFQIERSSDGRTFKTIGETAGAGNSSELRDYQFTDERPLIGKNYYRIKQIDFDGSFDYSPIEIINLSTNSEISIYPSVTNAQVNVKLPTGASGDAIVRVFSLDGQILFMQNKPSEELQFVDLSRFTPGQYFIQVFSENKTATQRVVKL